MEANVSWRSRDDDDDDGAKVIEGKLLPVALRKSPEFHPGGAAVGRKDKFNAHDMTSIGLWPPDVNTPEGGKRCWAKPLVQL